MNVDSKPGEFTEFAIILPREQSLLATPTAAELALVDMEVGDEGDEDEEDTAVALASEVF
ncbi:MAG: hypothetical protein HC838_01140 [Spirulinaceae cyanobacterium RM2_2_10]|nr:hypothetical protein [Spirulinaceae cyanobacterium RM2_2_10]